VWESRYPDRRIEKGEFLMTKHVVRLALATALTAALGLAGTAAGGQANVPFELLSFTASKPTKATKTKPRMVTIRWRTTTEVDVDVPTGFTLYRLVGTKKPVKLNRLPIELKRSVAGATYSRIDKLPRTVKGRPCYRLDLVAGNTRTVLRKTCSKK
jgi:hypothetical protein